MKRSIFIAFIILAAVVGWIGSGQFTNNVVAQDDNTETSTETETSYSQDTENNDNKDFTFTPRIYTDNKSIFQNEYRQVNKNSSIIADFSLNKKNSSSKSHFFSNSLTKLNLSNFSN